MAEDADIAIALKYDKDRDNAPRVIAKGMRLTSLAIYLLMGWIAIFALEPLIKALTWNGFAWLLGGGLVYTVGIVFYLYDERFKLWHGIWHLFVLAGSITHYCAILLFVA